MPEKLREKLKHSKTFITSDLNIVRYLGGEGISPYNIEPSKKHNNINMYFYGNSSMLRACLYHYYDRYRWNPWKYSVFYFPTKKCGTFPKIEEISHKKMLQSKTI